MKSEERGSTSPTVYLDQNKWIEVARVINGREEKPDAELRDAVSWVQSSSATDLARFPLSAIHYFETSKIGNHERRARLGRVLWEISRGYTLPSYGVVLRHELEVALKHFFPERVTEQAFSVLGYGASHAFAEDLTFRLPPHFRSRLSPDDAERFEAASQQLIEQSLLTGVGHDGETMPSPDLSKFATQFQGHVALLRERLSAEDKDLADRALYAIELLDMGDLLWQELARHRIRREEIEALGVEGATAIVEAMPTRHIDLQLHRQYLKNTGLQAKETDLNDWAGLAPAAAYCDFVVCEKQFADLVGRDGFDTHATILTDVRELPEAVHATSRDLGLRQTRT